MLADMEKALIAAMRKDARFTFTGLSRRSGFPQSTLFEKLKGVRQEYVLRCHALIDWERAGFPIRVFAVMKKAGTKNALRMWLGRHPNVNSVQRINNGLDFCVDAIFPHLDAAEKFFDELHKRGAVRLKRHLVVSTMREEHFLTEHSHFEGAT